MSFIENGLAHDYDLGASQGRSLRRGGKGNHSWYQRTGELLAEQANTGR